MTADGILRVAGTSLLFAGVLFVVPGVMALMALSWIYAGLRGGELLAPFAAEVLFGSR